MEEFRPIEPEETYITETHSSPEPMRQPVFEFRTENGENAYRDFLGSIYPRFTLPWIIIYLLMSAGWFAYMLIVHKHIYSSNIVICSFLLAASAFFYFINKRRVNKSVEQKKYQSGGKISPLRVCFFEDEIVEVNDDPDKTLNISYGDVKSVKKSDLLYILELQHKVYSLAPNDNISVNAEVSFEKYITEKATGMKKKKIGSTKVYKTLSVIFLTLHALLAAASVVLYFVIK